MAATGTPRGGRPQPPRATVPGMGERFDYRFDRRWAGLFATLRVKGSDGVEITDDGRLLATYGWAKIDTPVTNVDHTEISGPHRWWTAVGLRLSFADDGITFGTNSERGLCIGFVERVPKVIGWRPHSALWVSVTDPEGLAAAIESAGGGPLRGPDHP